ncbi:hypothetical protein L195_g059638, partial [Trifolium pratense]
SLQAHAPDKWMWQSHLDDVYTVWGAYQLLTTQDAVALDVALDYLPKQTWLLKGFYLRRPIIVSLVAERLSRLITCSFLAALLVPFGLLSALGLTLLW